MSEEVKGKPFERAAEKGLLAERARIWGKWVLDAAIDGGISEEELAEMRGRMNEWYGIVKDSMSLPLSDRREYLRREYVRLYGHDGVPF